MAAGRIDQNSPGGKALQAAVQGKLREYLGAEYSDDVLPLYIVVMLAHGNDQQLVTENLTAFLGEGNAPDFAAWLFKEVENNAEQYVTPPGAPAKPAAAAHAPASAAEAAREPEQEAASSRAEATARAPAPQHQQQEANGALVAERPARPRSVIAAPPPRTQAPEDRPRDERRRAPLGSRDERADRERADRGDRAERERVERERAERERARAREQESLRREREREKERERERDRALQEREREERERERERRAGRAREPRPEPEARGAMPERPRLEGRLGGRLGEAPQHMGLAAWPATMLPPPLPFQVTPAPPLPLRRPSQPAAADWEAAPEEWDWPAQGGRRLRGNEYEDGPGGEWGGRESRQALPHRQRSRSPVGAAQRAGSGRAPAGRLLASAVREAVGEPATLHDRHGSGDADGAPGERRSVFARLAGGALEPPAQEQPRGRKPGVFERLDGPRAPAADGPRSTAPAGYERRLGLYAMAHQGLLAEQAGHSTSRQPAGPATARAAPLVAHVQPPAQAAARAVPNQERVPLTTASAPTTPVAHRQAPPTAAAKPAAGVKRTLAAAANGPTPTAPAGAANGSSAGPAGGGEDLEEVRRKVRKMELELTKLRAGQREKVNELAPHSATAAQLAADLRTAVVNNVHPNATESVVEAFFHQCGEVKRVMLNPRIGKAFVEFADEAGMAKALQLDGGVILQNKVSVAAKAVASAARMLTGAPAAGRGPGDYIGRGGRAGFAAGRGRGRAHTYIRPAAAQTPAAAPAAATAASGAPNSV